VTCEDATINGRRYEAAPSNTTELVAEGGSLDDCQPPPETPIGDPAVASIAPVPNPTTTPAQSGADGQAVGATPVPRQNAAEADQPDSIGQGEQFNQDTNRRRPLGVMFRGRYRLTRKSSQMLEALDNLAKEWLAKRTAPHEAPPTDSSAANPQPPPSLSANQPSSVTEPSNPTVMLRQACGIPKARRLQLEAEERARQSASKPEDPNPQP
jgi:hypothetical protein